MKLKSYEWNILYYAYQYKELFNCANLYYYFKEDCFIRGVSANKDFSVLYKPLKKLHDLGLIWVYDEEWVSDRRSNGLMRCIDKKSVRVDFRKRQSFRISSKGVKLKQKIYELGFFEPHSFNVIVTEYGKETIALR